MLMVAITVMITVIMIIVQHGCDYKYDYGYHNHSAVSPFRHDCGPQADLKPILADFGNQIWRENRTKINAEIESLFLWVSEFEKIPKRSVPGQRRTPKLPSASSAWRKISLLVPQAA